MSWNHLLKHELEAAYTATEGLVQLVRDSELDWKPAAENNWMTVGQLLHHLTTSTAACFKGFITGDWGMPKDVDAACEGLPPASAMPTVSNCAEALQWLQKDKEEAFALLAQTSEDDLNSRQVKAPWDPVTAKILGHFLLDMVNHLQQHKYQLFYYLKLQGKPVNTFTLYGMKEG
ncbi:MAG: DinB family protein [bacterium]|jgi:uncharacterized damage-inducible protein DinB|nr:DinB family protein [bacterium]